MKAVFLGRFQPFHKGHHKVVENNKDSFEDFAVVIGSSQESRTEENPLTVEERKEIIKACFPEVKIYSLDDHEEDEVWINNLKDKTGANAVLAQNKTVKQLVSEDKDLELIEHDLHDREIYSGSEARRRIKSGEEWRYLTPECAKETIEKYVDEIKESGVQYEFQPGWKKENAYHGTADN